MRDGQRITVGMRVKVGKLESTMGFIVREKHMKVRKTGVTGTVRCYVPGHGGDVWFIQHDDGAIGAYGTDEFEPE